MNIIEADNIVRTYGQGRSAFTAVDHVSCSVAKGELVAVVGVNGAGKTSLVEVLEGLAAPASGTVRVFGLDPIRDRSTVRASTGIMLQEAGFASDLTVNETLSMWAGTLDNPRPIREALDLTDLAHRAGIRVSALSGGEKRRLDLSMAILGRPQLLFLDEPTTGLDPASRRRTWDLVRSMLEEGVSIVLTTHYMEEAENLADRILVMGSGRIISQGSTRSLAAARPATISFITNPAIDQTLLASLPALIEHPAIDARRTLLRTSDLDATLAALMGRAAARGTRLVDLDARAASLEDAFLSLTSSPATFRSPNAKESS